MLIHIAIRRQTVFLSDEEVIGTKARCRMYTAGTCICRYMIPQNYQGFAIIQRVLTGDHFQLASLIGCQLLLCFQTKLLPQRIHQLYQNDQLALFAFHKRIGVVLIQTDSQIGRNGPWCRCPDDKGSIAVQNALAILHRKFHENRRTFDILVFNFRFRQCGFTGRTPVNRLQSLINQTVHRHGGKNFNLMCFKILGQCDIRMIVIADNTQ